MDHSRFALARGLHKLQAQLASVHALASSFSQLWFSLRIVSGPGLALEINAPNIPSWKISCCCSLRPCGRVTKNMVASGSGNIVVLHIEALKKIVLDVDVQFKFYFDLILSLNYFLRMRVF